MLRLSMVGLTTLAVISFTALVSCSAAGLSSPEDRLAGHIADMTEIMEDNEDEPAAGVEELHMYMQDNLPSMMEAIGSILVEVDKIEDPGDRAEHIEEVVEALEDPIKDFEKASEDFGEEAAEDDDAADYVEDWSKDWEKTAKKLDDLEDFMEMMEFMN